MKKLLLALLIFAGSSPFIISKAQTITTVAGNGTQGYSGDGGPATAAEFYYPNAVGFDGPGNMYVADESNNVIRKINSLGVISTAAGDKALGGGYSGDGGPATAAELNAPEGVWGDKNGNIYIADLLNFRIRKVSASGIISTYAGTGTSGFSGDGGPATAAELNFPYRVAVDTAGNIFIADQGNNRIRKIDASGIITTLAGNGTSGFSGDGGPATAAELKDPYGVTVDLAGNVYLVDGNERARKINASGIISTIAGNGTGGFSGDGGQATAAELSGPFGIAADALGNIYIDDQVNNRIRMVNSAGIISTVAGDGSSGYYGDGGPATLAEINDAWDVSVDASGNVYIADEVNQRVREISGIPANINAPSEGKINIAVYPNPSHGKFTIKSSVPDGECSVEIYDILGEKAYSTTLSIVNCPLLIDLSNKPAGMYFYNVVNEDGSLAGNGKLVIE